ncbi:MAG: SMC-Scp complex subunit ScpB [Rhodospirillales bacterium]|nr:SMC-Scp complex subunit ScpB [Acetobacter sp.]
MLGSSPPAARFCYGPDVMTPTESAFLERAVVQLLFVSGREFSIEGLREKLRELFVQEPDAAVRAAASVGSFELLQVLLKTTQKLEKLGLRLDMRAGGVRITTAEVRPTTLRNYLSALTEQARTDRPDGTADEEEGAGPLSTTGLEVLACIAFKQPLSMVEINAYFSTDKRAVVHRLQHLGLVDCRTAAETSRTVWMTTGEFLRRFNLQSPSDLERLLSGDLAQAA